VGSCLRCSVSNGSFKLKHSAAYIASKCGAGASLLLAVELPYCMI
jgi:hypothetical protein